MKRFPRQIAFAFALFLAACSALVGVDRTKVPDDLYQPTPPADAGAGGAGGAEVDEDAGADDGGAGGATGDAAVPDANIDVGTGDIGVSLEAGTG